jgi:hypothetical protein
LNFGIELVQYLLIREDWPQPLIEQHNLTAMYLQKINASRLKEALAETIT